MATGAHNSCSPLYLAWGHGCTSPAYCKKPSPAAWLLHPTALHPNSPLSSPTELRSICSSRGSLSTILRGHKTDDEEEVYYTYTYKILTRIHTSLYATGPQLAAGRKFHMGKKNSGDYGTRWSELGQAKKHAWLAPDKSRLTSCLLYTH